MNNFNFCTFEVKILRNFRNMIPRKTMTPFAIDEENRFSTQLNISHYFIQKNSSADRAVKSLHTLTIFHFQATTTLCACV